VLPVCHILGGGGNRNGPTYGSAYKAEYLELAVSTIGFDCSGLVAYAYGKVDKTIALEPAYAQYAHTGNRYGRYWLNPYLHGGTGREVDHSYEIDRSELIPGDLLFFSKASPPRHVAIYLGGGWKNGLMIEAPQTLQNSYTQDVVRVARIDEPGTPYLYRRDKVLRYL
jgi:cell wall-associated NlpC family hydrolase